MKIKAFSLLEILLIILIIGVVAGMTLPSLINSYQKFQTGLTLKKFYADINNAIRMSTIDNGPSDNWIALYEGTGSKPETLKWLNKYIIPYLKVSKIEYPKNWGHILIILQNGDSIRWTKNSTNTFEIDYYIGKKTNGKNSNNMRYQFYFIFYADKGIVEPWTLGWDGTLNGKNGLLTKKDGNGWGCSKKVKGNHAYCTKYIQLNNWKIPKDYPW